MSQRRALLKALTVLSKNFDKELDDDNLAIHEMVLKTLNEEQIDRMLYTALCSRREYMPRVGQLLNMGLRGESNPESEGEVEWSLLERALHFDETRQLRPRTRRVALSFGTFTQIQEMTHRDFHFLRPQFVRRYVEDCYETDGHEDRPALEKPKKAVEILFVRPVLKLST